MQNTEIEIPHSEVPMEEMLEFIKVVNWDVVPDSIIEQLYHELKNLDVL